MNPKVEKILTPIILGTMFLEVVISVYLLYTMTNAWIPILFIVLLLFALALTVGIVTKVYETADMSKEPEEYAIQSETSNAAFYRISSIILWFPIRAIIVYYIYTAFEHGTLYILLYLLFLTQKTGSGLNITSKIADASYLKKT